MADLLTTKISELPQLTTPQTGAVIPIVSGGQTYKLPIENLVPALDDYVVSHGTTSGWEWTKMNSGKLIAETVASVTLADATAWTQSEWLWLANFNITLPSISGADWSDCKAFVSLKDSNLGNGLYYSLTGVAPALSQIQGKIVACASAAPGTPATHEASALLIGSWS